MSKYNFDLELYPPNSLSLIIDMIKPNTKVLEFGPAHGRLTKYLKENLNCVVDIVELDFEAGKEASQYANRALLGVKDGDIENYIWFDLYNKGDYDYIIFADVLEHLRRPQDVVRKCCELLNDSGSILISLPNIAHNSILINLYFNRFKYTDLGLLDDTHLKFFALEDLATLYKHTGLSITEFHTLEVPSELTEQAQFFTAAYKKVEKLLSDRKFGNVYQFVFKLEKIEHVDIEIESIDETGVERIKTLATLYFDHGTGYNQQDKETRILDALGNIKVRFNISENTKSLRFNPIEGVPCNVRILDIKTDARINSIQPINSTKEYSENEYFDEFLNTDPMYEITGDFENATYIEIEAEINLINNLDFIDRTCSIIGKVLTDCYFTKKELATIRTQFEHIHNELLQTKNQFQIVLELKQETENQLHHAEALLQQTQSQLQQTQSQLQQTQASLTEIVNSTCWKITKPIRFVLDCIKMILKKRLFK